MGDGLLTGAVRGAARDAPRRRDERVRRQHDEQCDPHHASELALCKLLLPTVCFGADPGTRPRSDSPAVLQSS